MGKLMGNEWIVWELLQSVIGLGRLKIQVMNLTYKKVCANEKSFLMNIALIILFFK